MAWYDYNPQRVLQEQQIMTQKFPQFQMLMVDKQLAWIGSLETNRNNTYSIVVKYPDEFPNKEPLVYPIEPIIEAQEASGKYKHQYPDGRLCLYYPGSR